MTQVIAEVKILELINKMRNDILSQIEVSAKDSKTCEYLCGKLVALMDVEGMLNKTK
jgi:hypothetical protein